MRADQGKVGRGAVVRAGDVLQLVEGRSGLAARQARERQGGLLAGIGRIELQRLGEILFGLLRVAVLQVRLPGNGVQARVDGLVAEAGSSTPQAPWPLPGAKVGRDQQAARKPKVRRGSDGRGQIGLGLVQRIQLQLDQSRELEVRGLGRSAASCCANSLATL